MVIFLKPIVLLTNNVQSLKLIHHLKLSLSKSVDIIFMIAFLLTAIFSIVKIFKVRRKWCHCTQNHHIHQSLATIFIIVLWWLLNYFICNSMEISCCTSTRLPILKWHCIFKEFESIDTFDNVPRCSIQIMALNNKTAIAKFYFTTIIIITSTCQNNYRVF